MSIQRLTIAKPSRKSSTIRGLCRAFAIFIGGITPRKPKKPRRKYRSSNALYYLDRHQLERLMAAGKTERDRLILRTFVETGLRRFELAALRIEDVDTRNAFLTVKAGKGRKPRIIPITKSLIAGLKRHLGSRTLGPVFLSRNGGSVSLRQLNRIVAEAGAMANIRNPNPKQNNVTCHLLRHSFARQWKERGGDIEILSLLMGHSSVKTTYDSYARFGVSDIRRQYRKLIG